jgi:hypothetical protein
MIQTLSFLIAAFRPCVFSYATLLLEGRVLN